MPKQSKAMKPTEAAQRWVRKTAIDTFVDQSLVTGEFEKDGPGTDDTVSPEIIIKNKFLGLMDGLIEIPSSSARQVLSALEIQAQSMDSTKDRRHHQLRGLLDIVGSVAKDPELSQLFADSSFGDTVE